MNDDKLRISWNDYEFIEISVINDNLFHLRYRRDDGYNDFDDNFDWDKADVLRYTKSRISKHWYIYMIDETAGLMSRFSSKRKLVEKLNDIL